MGGLGGTTLDDNNKENQSSLAYSGGGRFLDTSITCYDILYLLVFSFDWAKRFEAPLDVI